MEVLLLVGLAVAVVGSLWLIVVAFQESALWGIGVLVVPFVSLVFTVMHWKVAKRPFLVSLVGGVLCGIGAALAGPQLEAAEEVARLVGAVLARA